MENCASGVFPQEAPQGQGNEILRGACGFPQEETLPQDSLQQACQLLVDLDSGARFMKGILLGVLLSGSIWAGILLLVL